MTTKATAAAHTTLTAYLKTVDVTEVTAVALDRAISEAIKAKKLNDMYASTSNEEKYTIDDKGKIIRGMTAQGYQKYRNDYVIFNEAEFDNWYKDTYLPSLHTKTTTAKPTAKTIADIIAMTAGEREEHNNKLQEAKDKAAKAAAKNLTSVEWKKTKASVDKFLTEKRPYEAKSALDNYTPRQGKAQQKYLDAKALLSARIEAAMDNVSD